MSRPILMGNTSCYGKPFAEEVKKEIIDRCISSCNHLIEYNLEQKNKLTPEDIRNGMEMYYTGMNDALAECISKIKTCDCVNNFFNVRNYINEKYESLCNNQNNSDYYKGMCSGYGNGKSPLELGIDMYRDVLYHRDSETYGRYVGEEHICVNCKNFIPTIIGRTNYGITRKYYDMTGQCKYARDVLHANDVAVKADNKCTYTFDADCCTDNCRNEDTVYIGDSDKVSTKSENITPRMSKEVFEVMTFGEKTTIKDCIWQTMCDYESRNKYEYDIYTERWVYKVINGQFVAYPNNRGTI